MLGMGSRKTPAGLSVGSYRAIEREGAGELQIWQSPLEIDKPSPTVPLWLGGDLAVPLDFDASHSAASDDLRIRHAG